MKSSTPSDGCRVLPTGACRGMAQKIIESENIGGNKIFENAERKNNFEVEKLGAKLL